ncbi:PREDICTED: stAR-related lipid transfer protein 7, mitochondrial isoform X1 [Trachymyrmex cornetzi]|uniref:Phosphatidylcholine transfer protein n=1 Tax=Trachymyrmex cornetzi TaxID=471704 RepID=A0A151IZ44_9HYME|nr:PREDICTED: stAR-related lipid transfer protein 7, mitochondrial isoform X1 [Trachymyrmex cornetzi]KYN14022.1 StAR-related lipid transfer protein 7, mitochondrial [Trachymyrmex cornetzi]
MYTWRLSGYALRRFNTGYGNGTSKLALVLQHCGPRTQGRGKLGSYRRRISSWFREQGTQAAQACKKQFEFVAAQRIRRYIQIFHLYTRIWDEVALREFMRLWRLRLAKNAKNFLISAAGVSMYNWDRDRISDEEINRYNREIEGIYRLRDSTVVCTKCHLRIVIDIIQPDIKYCKCSGVQPSDASDENLDGWQPFIERQDMLIWRKVEPDSGGLFAYKVYGSFSDVTAEDFLQVQIDVDYRKQWDPTAQELQIIETDPKFKSSVNHSTDVIHWEMIWPKLFSNRDYVYQRRWIMDREKGLVVIVSRVTEHPNVPERRGIYRVRTYWSYMVIKPYTEFHEPGIEFGLTYFDDPGVSVPSAVTAWVALRGLPDFLIRMRQASKDYQKYKLMKKNAPDSNHFTLSEEDVSKQQIDVEDKLKNNKKSMRDHKDQQDDSTNDTNKLDLTHDVQQENDLAESENKDTISTPKEEQGLLHYFYLTKLFAFLDF